MLVFTEEPREKSSERGENQQQTLETQPTYGNGPESNRIPITLVGGERSHHCAIPAGLSWRPVTEPWNLQVKPREEKKEKRTFYIFVFFLGALIWNTRSWRVQWAANASTQKAQLSSVLFCYWNVSLGLYHLDYSSGKVCPGPTSWPSLYICEQRLRIYYYGVTKCLILMMDTFIILLKTY